MRAIGELNRSRKSQISLVKYKFIFYLASSSASSSSLLKLPNGIKGELGVQGPPGLEGQRGESGTSGIPGTLGVMSYKNWKEGAWKNLDDDKDHGLIKVSLFCVKQDYRKLGCLLSHITGLKTKQTGIKAKGRNILEHIGYFDRNETNGSDKHLKLAHLFD